MKSRNEAYLFQNPTHPPAIPVPRGTWVFGEDCPGLIVVRQGKIPVRRASRYLPGHLIGLEQLRALLEATTVGEVLRKLKGDDRIFANLPHRMDCDFIPE